MDAGLLRSSESAAVEVDRRLNYSKTNSENAHCFMPKASAPRFHQSNGSRLSRALLALRKCSRVLRHSRAPADCFGANPVASALGNLVRRDPGEAMRTYHEGRKVGLQRGTFYFGGNRNFLLWPDSGIGGQPAAVDTCR